MERRFQSYRGTWAWLAQRVSAIGLFLLIPVKIYSGWAGMSKVPFPESLGSAVTLHLNAAVDISILLFFLVHALYGLRVILIDIGAIREDAFFWRTLAAALVLFGLAVWFVYVRPHPAADGKAFAGTLDSGPRIARGARAGTGEATDESLA